MLCAFAWTIPNVLAGSGRPGLLSPIEEDMEFIRKQGIQYMVTLTESALQPTPESFGLVSLHFPIADMGIAQPRIIDSVCQEIIGAMHRSLPVLIHCKAGLGRTGMVLACCLVATGMEPPHALAHVRGINARYVQTAAQEKLISHYAQFLKNKNP